MNSVSQTLLQDLFTLDAYYDHNQLNDLFDIVEHNLGRMAAQIDSTRIGQSLFAYDAAVESSLQVGEPVYFNSANQRFERTQIQVLNSGGRLYAAESSEAWGLVSLKCSADRAHILLSGLGEINLFSSTGEAAPTGKFYLSSVAGKLSGAPDSSIVVPVLIATGTGEVLFRPWFADTFPRYVPSLVDLLTSPAGTPATSGGVVVINGANPGLQGWLPATHPTFEGNQPAGAKFGYNRSRDEKLAQAWPPLDPAACKIYLESGGSSSFGSRVLLNSNNRVLVNEDGIWWMNNCPGQTPWDIPAEGSTSGTCPLPYARRMVLEADFGVYGGSLPSNISSLKSNIPWLKYYKQGTTNTADVGNLSLNLDATSLYETTASTGSLAIKSVASSGKLNSGPVVVGVKSVSPSLAIVGGTSTSGGYKYGQLDLSVTSSKDFDLLPVDTQLFSAQTESYAETLAIGLPPQRPSSFVSTYHIPHTVPDNSTIRFVFWLMAQTLINLPTGLKTRVRVFKNPDAADQQIPAESALVLNYQPGKQLASGHYTVADTNLVTVSGGDMVYIRFSRDGGTDGVSGELHVLKQFAKFENA